MKHSVDIPLHDILGPLEMESLSVFPFIVMVCVVAALLIFVYTRVKRFAPLPIDERAQCYEVLCRIDLSHSKQAAYTISQQAPFFVYESDDASKALYQQLMERLERYKYAPDVPPMDEETKALYQQWIQSIGSKTI